MYKWHISTIFLILSAHTKILFMDHNSNRCIYRIVGDNWDDILIIKRAINPTIYYQTPFKNILIHTHSRFRGTSDKTL